jgi:hypothetical protein
VKIPAPFTGFLGTRRQFNDFVVLDHEVLPESWGALANACRGLKLCALEGTLSSAIVLLALSLIVGFALRRLSWRATALSSVALAVLAAVVLQQHGFGVLPGIAIIVVCLVLHQSSYLAAMWFADLRSRRSVQKQASDDPG